MFLTLNRRQALTMSVGALALAASGGTTSPALAAKNDSEELIKKFTGGKTATEKKSGLSSLRMSMETKSASHSAAALREQSP